MRNFANLLSMATVVAMVSMSAHAATSFNNADVNNSLITTSGNWDSGLPTGGNSGTLAINATYDTAASMVGYNITHTAGTLSRGAGLGSLPIGAGSTFRMNGATAQLGNTRGVGVNGADASFILDQGNADATNNSRDSSVNGTGDIIVNGGTLSIGRHLYLINGDITVNGGALNVASDLGSRNFHSGGNLNLNGGATTAKYLTYGTGGLDLTFGGNTAGTFTIENFGGGRANVNNIGISFLSGTLMAMTLTNPVESGASGDGDLGWSKVGSETGLAWAEALWATGRLTYNGDGFDQLGDWATVTTTGLGDGSTFSYDANTHTLSLETTAVPEPASLAMGLAGLTLLAGRCRRQ